VQQSYITSVCSLVKEEQVDLLVKILLSRHGISSSTLFFIT
jgi:hypothetical protein